MSKESNFDILIRMACEKILEEEAQEFLSIDTSDVFEFLSYLPNERSFRENSPAADYGISASSRARKLSAIKSFYKYLTIRTKQLQENPVADLEYPKLRKSLPKYLTMEQSAPPSRASSQSGPWNLPLWQKARNRAFISWMKRRPENWESFSSGPMAP